jgi:hypothetical protein
MKRVSAIIFYRIRNNNYEFLLQHRARFMKHGGYRLSLVQGSVDSDETILEGAYREAGEETSIDKYCSYKKFARHAKQITKGVYNVFLVNINKLNCLNSWKPIPQKKFMKEVEMSILPYGHVWIDMKTLYKMSFENIPIGHLYLWSKTRHFFQTMWSHFIKKLKI